MRGLLLLLTALAIPPAWAATDLVAAWEAAAVHDPIFQAARAQWQAGSTKERQSRAQWLPQLVLTGAVSRGSSDQDTRGAQFNAPGFGSSDDVEFRTKIDAGQASRWAVSAKQPLYDAERFANARQLGRQAQLAEVQFRLAQQELILRTARAYFAVLLAEDTLSTLQARRQAAARAFDVAKEKFDAGALPVTDREEARARLDEIASEELVAQNDVQMSRAALSDLTGAPSDRLHRLAPDAPPDRFRVDSLQAWMDRAAQNNLLMAMQELGRDIARDEVDKFRALTSASLDLVAQVAADRMHGDSGFGATNITSTTRTIGVQLTIPLFTGGMRSAKHDEAAALAEKARLDVDALRQLVRRQTQSAWLGVSTGAAQVHAHEQALRSAQSRLGATETGAEVGARTTLELMNAQSDFYRIRRDLAQARYRLLLDRLALAATAGELTDVDLKEVNASLAQ